MTCPIRSCFDFDCIDPNNALPFARVALDNDGVSLSEMNLHGKDLIESVKTRLGAMELPRGLEVPAARLSELPKTLANVERRLTEGANSPLRLALFGPTGVGKSKIFNSLLGSVVSPAGFRRPFTMRPVYSVHESHSDLSSRMEGDIRIRKGDLWRDMVLIDTPDFDSVEQHNREEAERVLLEAEAFVFVTDVQKYADHSTWEYLERISAENKPLIIVLNKAVSEGAELDFRSRLDRKFHRSDIEVIRERPIDDATLIPSDDVALQRIGQRVSEILGTPTECRALLVSAFRADLRRLFESWDASASTLRKYLAGVEALRVRLSNRFERAGATIVEDVSTPLDPSVKAEVYERVLERLRAIDVLRYPRRLLALPFEGLRLLAGKWWPSRKDASRTSPEEASRNQGFQVVESRLLSLVEETRADFQSEARCPCLLCVEVASAMRIPHSELVELHRVKEAEFRAWLEREARDTASRLTTESKLKFILSQVIYNGIFVGIQIHTAGHFTLLEAATDGVLSPLFAKAVGMVVSSEKVGQFEKMARAERARLLSQVLDAGKARFERYLDSTVAWQAAFESVSRDMEQLESEGESLLEAYANVPVAVSPPPPAESRRTRLGGDAVT